MTHDLEDDLIQALIDAVIEYAEEYTGRTFYTSEMEATTEVEATSYLIEKFTPISSIDSVVDKDGLPIAHYQNGSEVVIDEPVESAQYPLVITYTSNPLQDNYVAITAMKLKLKDFYDYRGDRPVLLNRSGQFTNVVDQLLKTYKITSFSP